MDYILSPTLTRLHELMSEEVKVLSGIEDHVKSLQTKLNSLQNLLKHIDINKFDRMEGSEPDDDFGSDDDSEAVAAFGRDRLKTSHRPVVRDFLTPSIIDRTYHRPVERDLIDASREVEDVVEKYALKSESVAAGGAISFLKRLAFNDEHEARTKIESLSDRFDNILKSLNTRLLNEGLRASEIASSKDKYSSSSSHVVRQTRVQNRRNKSPMIRHDIIGIAEKVEQVVESLLDVRKGMSVAIYDLPGRGRTTLAKKVYHHTKVRCHFDYFVWVDIYYNPSGSDGWDNYYDHVIVEILQRLISSKGEQMDENANYLMLASREEKKSKLDEILRGDKYLVVLSDKFSTGGEFEGVWGRFLPHPIKGSKFLCIFGPEINRNVLHFISGSHLRKIIIHRLPGLSSEDAWQLLQAIIGSVKDCSCITDGYHHDRLETSGRKIAKHLSRWPLAIMIAGGLLASNPRSLEWLRLYDCDFVCLEDPRNDLFMISFRALPTGLQQCLFYLSQFPAGYEINVTRLVRLWIAEGFVSSRVPETADTEEGETLEDLAESNLIELISRCLVLVGDRDASLRVKTCHLHEFVRRLCLSEEYLSYPEEYLFYPNLHFSAETNFMIHKRTHSFRFPTSDGAELRSLLFFQREYGRTNFSCPNFNEYKLFRVLDLQEADFSEVDLPKSIGELIHLQYLSLRNARISKIPSTLGNLRFLQTLDLLITGKSLYVPDVILKLKRLRHLFLPEVCHAKAKLRLDTLTNLRTLVNFPARICDVKDIFIMTKLRELTIRDAISIRNFPRFSKALGMKQHLQKFSLHGSSREGDKGAEEYEDINSASFGDTVDPRT